MLIFFVVEAEIEPLNIEAPEKMEGLRNTNVKIKGGAILLSYHYTTAAAAAIIIIIITIILMLALNYM